MKFRFLILITLISFSFLSVSAKKRKLDLSSQGISDLSLIEIPNSIRSLNLSFNTISSLEGLELPGKIKKLFLYDNQITSIDALKGNSSLEKLELSQNEFIDISDIAKFNNLRDLRLFANKYNDDNFNVSTLPRSLEKLNLAANLLEILDLNEFTNLKELLVNDMFAVEDGGDGRDTDYSKYIFPPNIEELRVGNVTRSDDFTTLTLPENLKKLSLFAAFLTDEEFQTLTLSPNLKVINLKQNRLTTLDGIDFPASIKKLNLQKNNFSKQEKRNIKKRFGKKVRIKF